MENEKRIVTLNALKRVLGHLGNRMPSISQIYVNFELQKDYTIKGEKQKIISVHKDEFFRSPLSLPELVVLKIPFKVREGNSLDTWVAFSQRDIEKISETLHKESFVREGAVFCEKTATIAPYKLPWAPVWKGVTLVGLVWIVYLVAEKIDETKKPPPLPSHLPMQGPAIGFH